MYNLVDWFVFAIVVVISVVVLVAAWKQKPDTTSAPEVWFFRVGMSALVIIYGTAIVIAGGWAIT